MRDRHDVAPWLPALPGSTTVVSVNVTSTMATDMCTGLLPQSAPDPEEAPLAPHVPRLQSLQTLARAAAAAPEARFLRLALQHVSHWACAWSFTTPLSEFNPEPSIRATSAVMAKPALKPQQTILTRKPTQVH